MKLKIYQSGEKDRQDSFWYNGTIASIGKYILIATGEIRIHSRKGEIAVRDEDFLDDEFKEKVINDKTLNKYVGLNYDDKWHWENNNWFEVVYGEIEDSGVLYIEDCDMGVVSYDYDEAIDMLKQYAKERTFEK